MTFHSAKEVQEMTANYWRVLSCAALRILGGNGAHASATSETVNSAKAQITVLYDAFGQTSAMQKDFGIGYYTSGLANAMQQATVCV